MLRLMRELASCITQPHERIWVSHDEEDVGVWQVMRMAFSRHRAIRRFPLILIHPPSTIHPDHLHLLQAVLECPVDDHECGVLYVIAV